MVKRVLTGFVLALVAVSIMPMPVLAITAPDTLQINAVYVYQHLLEADDQLYIVDYTVDYDTNPDSGIVDTFIGRLMNGATELGGIAPYSFYDNGYDRGIFAIYFSESEAPAWEGAYTVTLEGNPPLNWSQFNETADVALGGTLAYDVPSYTDETMESNDASANDMTLLPATPAVGDGYYFGGDYPFNILTLNIGTQGEWVGTYTWEYWDGDGWATPDGIVDETDGFTAETGNKNVTFVCPDDWARKSVSGLSMYWLRLRVVTYTSVTTQPLGTQAWINGEASSPPYTSTSTFDLWSTSTSLGATSEELTARVLYFGSILEMAWGLDLVEVTGAGSRLADYGEAYFTSVIPNLRVVCPNLFIGQMTQPDIPEREYTQDYADDLAGEVVGTPLDLTNVANSLGMSRMFASSMLWLVGMGIALGLAVHGTGSYRPAVFLSVPMIVAGALLGMLPLVLAVVLGFFAVLGIAYVLFYQKSVA